MARSLPCVSTTPVAPRRSTPSERALAEVRRLERIFSLYREDSALVALNARGALEAPPPELVELLTECRKYAELTEGAFDPTVQPLWQLFAAHFSQAGADPAGPPQAAIDDALDRVGHQHLVFDRNRVVFARRGMGLTLNGIAQGYITDRVVDLCAPAASNRVWSIWARSARLAPNPRAAVDGGDHRSRGARASAPHAEIVNQAFATSAGAPSSSMRPGASITSSTPGPAPPPSCIGRRV